MVNHQLNCSVTVDGTLLSCPARLAISKQNGSTQIGGVLRLGGRKVSDTLDASDSGLPKEISNHVDSLLPGCLPDELAVEYKDDSLMITVKDPGIIFKICKRPGQVAVLFVFETAQCRQAADPSALVKAVSIVADFFGIRELLFYAQSGNNWLLPQLQPDKKAFRSVPAEIKKSRFLTYAHIVLDGDSVFEQGVRTLFGLKETSLFLGAGNEGFTCMITLPSFKTSFLEGRDMYMLMELSKNPQFIIQGSFIFSFIPDMTFTVDCGVSNQSFRIEAWSHVTKPVKLLGPFAIGDSCLMIQLQTGLRFGLYSSLYIGEIQLFGAVMLNVQGSSVVPELLSATVSDLSIPILVNNLLGYPLPGIDVLDFIKILGFPIPKKFPYPNAFTFPSDVLSKKDMKTIAVVFNAFVIESLRLDPDQIQLTPFGTGYDLADLKRMRHYYINSSGHIQLAAQFYYSSVDTQLGNYTVSRGLFICGVIELFKKRFEVLFSFQEQEGLLAYAKIPSIDLGFLSIGPSQYSKNQPNALPLPKDSVMAQFLNPSQEGMVFFLSAGKKEISFYFDGSVHILDLFSADARIIFCKGLISIDLRVVWLSILQVSLHLSVNYGSFTSGQFKFRLVIDTAPLTEKLTAVTQEIDSAIGKLRNKINDATREVDRAQAHVNELYGQIAYFDRRIESCRRDIRNTSGLKKVFVAMAKGIEIGAYEVAKGGIYVAIGVATAALKVAKGVLSLTGKVGEGVLRAVNAVIKGAMSLFYLSYIELEASAGTKSNYFLAKIEFVALGKKYTLEKEIEKDALEYSASGTLSRAINDKLQYDLDHIEDGAFRSNWRKYRHETYTIEQHCRRLEGAKEHMNSSVGLMQSMQNTYVDEFQMSMEEFDEMNVSLIDALDQVENVLNTGAQAGNVAELGNAMGGLKRSVAAQEKKGVFRNEELAQTKQLIADYDEARMFYDKVLLGIRDVKKQKQHMQAHCDEIREKTASAGDTVLTGVNGDIGTVLTQVEEQMYDAFPVDRSGRDFINLSRERLIRDSFADAQDRLGVRASARVQNMRSRSRKGNYENRL